MANSISELENQKELARLDSALKDLRRVIDSDDEAELVEIARELSVNLAKAASSKMKTIRERQAKGEDVDGRAFSPVSIALEKVTRAIDSMGKRKKDKVEEQIALVQAETERVKIERGGSDMSDLARLIFPFQGNNRISASPVLKALNETNVKIDEAIDAEMVEVEDETPIDNH